MYHTPFQGPHPLEDMVLCRLQHWTVSLWNENFLVYVSSTYQKWFWIYLETKVLTLLVLLRNTLLEEMETLVPAPDLYHSEGTAQWIWKYPRPQRIYLWHYFLAQEKNDILRSVWNEIAYPARIFKYSLLRMQSMYLDTATVLHHIPKLMLIDCNISQQQQLAG